MIDVNRISRDIKFVPIITLPIEQQLEVLSIRNQYAVRKNMYSSHEIGEAEHLSWIEKLRSTDSSIFFAVLHEGQVIGAAGISSISRDHKRADWAFYISQHLHGAGLGASVEYHFLSWCFYSQCLWKLNCEVLEFNQPVIRLHQKFGFKVEGVRRDHILRDGLQHSTVLLGATRDEWEAAVGWDASCSSKADMVLLK